MKRSGLLAAVGPFIQATQHSVTLIYPPQGRTFSLTPLYKRSDLGSPIIDQIMPDGMVAITGIGSDQRWYAVTDAASQSSGYILRETVQPILPYTRPMLIEKIGTGFWAENIAPISAVREWCAGTAPILARLGFGAMVYVVDTIMAEGNQRWYGLAESATTPLIGWASALHYQPWIPPISNLSNPGGLLARISDQTRTLSVYQDHRLIVQMPIYGKVRLSGNAILSAQQPGGAKAPITPLGVPWLMTFDSGQPLYGAFWHNRFGLPAADMTAGALELSTFDAHWLYTLLVRYGGRLSSIVT